MPMGKGTYGSKKGRPAKKKKMMPGGMVKKGKKKMMPGGMVKKKKTMRKKK
tara:strand:+ start:196 stop:348 length:153 start_codon:yes stop_codon:yes gene_type:complete